MDWRVNEAAQRLDILQGLLRAPLQVTAVQSGEFSRQWVTRDAVVVTHRLLVLERGEINYTIEGLTHRLKAGTQFFVPAWCRRQWSMPRRWENCRLVWCEFSSGAVSLPPLLFTRANGAQDELRAFAALKRLKEQSEDRGAALRLEGELKGCLARFWTEADAVGARGESRSERHPEVVRAMVWLGTHYAEPDALELFYRTLGLSPNHFRLLFRKQTGETVQAVLARLRLRRARYLVQETALPMKQIAAASGFIDPLYFSNQYRKFWGKAATADRGGGGMA